MLSDQREHASLEPDHGADERVEPDEQRELCCVGAQPEAHVRRHHGVTASAPRLFAATTAAWSAGGGGRSTRTERANDSASLAASAWL
jgi:hypothetical protein